MPAYAHTQFWESIAKRQVFCLVFVSILGERAAVFDGQSTAHQGEKGWTTLYLRSVHPIPTVEETETKAYWRCPCDGDCLCAPCRVPRHNMPTSPLAGIEFTLSSCKWDGAANSGLGRVPPHRKKSFLFIVWLGATSVHPFCPFFVLSGLSALRRFTLLTFFLFSFVLLFFYSCPPLPSEDMTMMARLISASWTAIPAPVPVGGGRNLETIDTYYSCSCEEPSSRGKWKRGQGTWTKLWNQD